MEKELTDTLRLKTAKGPLGGLFCIAFVFFIIALTSFPPTPFFLVLKIVMLPTCLFSMVIFLTGLVTEKYDALLTREGIRFGTFSGNRFYRWNAIKAIYVINAVSGKEVCLELYPPSASSSSPQSLLKRLPGTYGIKPEELATILIRWQREYGNVQNN